MALKDNYISPKTGFIMLLIAAVIQFILDGSYWLEFLWNIIPEDPFPNLFYLIATLLFAFGMIIINGLFQNSTSRSINNLVVIGVTPFIVFRLLILTNLANNLPALLMDITESVFFLALAYGAYQYYREQINKFRLVLLIAFTVLFGSIALFYIGLNSGFTRANPDYYDLLLTLMGFGVAISCLTIIGCSIHYFIQESSTGITAAPVTSGNKSKSKFCINCGGTIESSDRFCPDCGFNLSERTDRAEVESQVPVGLSPEEAALPSWSAVSADPSRVDPEILKVLQKSICFMVRDEMRPVAAMIMRASADDFRVSSIEKCPASLHVFHQQAPGFNLFGIYPIIWDDEKEPYFRETWMTGVGKLSGPPDPLKEGEYQRLELLLTQDYTYFLAVDSSDKLVAHRKVIYSPATKKHFNSLLNSAKLNRHASISNIDFMTALQHYLNTVQLETVLAVAKKIR